MKSVADWLRARDKGISQGQESWIFPGKCKVIVDCSETVSHECFGESFFFLCKSVLNLKMIKNKIK